MDKNLNKEKLEVAYKKLGNLSDSRNSFRRLVDVISGEYFRENSILRKLDPWEKSFKYYVLKLMKSGVNPLTYPCKPNREEYLKYQNVDASVVIDPKVSNYSWIENELNRAAQGASVDFALTKNLHPQYLSHSTILDFLFANADMINDSKSSISVCFNAFLELYRDKPKFRKSFDENVLTQAMYSASKETRQYAVKVCHDLAEFSNKAFAEETALAHKSVEELMLESNRTFAERADQWEMFLEQGKRRRAYELWLKQGGQPKPNLAGDLFDNGKTPTIIHDYTISQDRPKLNPEDPIDEKQKEELLKALKEGRLKLDHKEGKLKLDLLVEGNHDHTLSEEIKPIYKYHGGDCLGDFTASNSDFKPPKPILKPISKEVLKRRLELYFKPQESSNQTIEQNFLEAKKQLDPSSSEEQVEQNKSAKEAPTKPNEGEGK